MTRRIVQESWLSGDREAVARQPGVCVCTTIFFTICMNDSDQIPKTLSSATGGCPETRLAADRTGLLWGSSG